MVPSADLTLGLNPQSLAVLHLMTGRYLPLKETPKTFAWYAGRENGISFVVPRGEDVFRIIIVGEDSRSEALFVEHWDHPHRPFNAPSIDDRMFAQAVLERRPFEAGALAAVAEHAVNLMRECLGEI